MAIKKDTSALYFNWYSIIIYIFTGVIVLLALFTDVFRSDDSGKMPLLFWLIGALMLLFTLIVILAQLTKLTEFMQYNVRTLDKVAEAFEKQRLTLEKIQQGEHLSETVKSIVYRDSDSRAVREVIFEKLSSRDFDTAYKLIKEVSANPAYRELADQLRQAADKYRAAPETERENQLIANIVQLLDEHQWAKASIQIENLIRAFPESEKAKEVRQKFAQKKQERKKALLNMWDDAIKRQATDRSLEILRELDQYLTPNEALALQEAARDVFRSKLHSLGVRFSIAVSGQQWEKALDTGQEIVRDFPNSRMAQEILERMDALKQRVTGSNEK
ncbi:MAG: hypothetical protein WCZ89_09415 [Phycisphaerae bacterium]